MFEDFDSHVFYVITQKIPINEKGKRILTKMYG